MRLSMNILADWLKKYDPKAGIRLGGRVIQNVRPFSDEHTIMPKPQEGCIFAGTRCFTAFRE